MIEPFISSSHHYSPKPLTKAERDKLQKSYKKVPTIKKEAELQHIQEDIPEAEELLAELESKKFPGQAKGSE